MTSVGDIIRWHAKGVPGGELQKGKVVRVLENGDLLVEDYQWVKKQWVFQEGEELKIVDLLLIPSKEDGCSGSS